MELMLAFLEIIQGVISTIMNAAGFGGAAETVLPAEIVTAIEDCGFFESIPLWAVKMCIRDSITNVAADTYTLDWNTKTITITAYPETKAESRLITRYIAESPLKFKRLVQPG